MSKEAKGPESVIVLPAPCSKYDATNPSARGRYYAIVEARLNEILGLDRERNTSINPQEEFLRVLRRRTDSTRSGLDTIGIATSIDHQMQLGGLGYAPSIGQIREIVATECQKMADEGHSQAALLLALATHLREETRPVVITDQVLANTTEITFPVLLSRDAEGDTLPTWVVNFTRGEEYEGKLGEIPGLQALTTTPPELSHSTPSTRWFC